MSVPFIIFWLVLLNSFSVALIVWAFTKLPSGRIRNALSLFLLGYLLWMNPSLVIWLSGFEKDMIVWIAKFIFAASLIMHSAFGYFIFSFCDEDELKNKRFYFYQIHNLLFIFLSFTDLIVSDVSIVDGRLNFDYGILHAYTIFSIAMFGFYIFFILGRAYKNTDNEILQSQIRSIFWAGLIAFFGIVITNGVIPLIFGNSGFSPIGTLLILFFYSALLYVIINGKTLFLFRVFRDLLNDESFKEPSNILAIRELLGSIGMILQNKSDEFKKRLRFAVGSNAPLDIYLSGIEPKLDVDITVKTIPQPWLKGILDNLLELESNNKRLGFSLIRAEELIKAKWLSEEIKKIPTSRKPHSTMNLYRFEDFKEIIGKNILENKETFGIEFLCFSPSLFQVTSNLRQFSKSNQAVIMEGESGVGKDLFIRAIHNLRGGGELEEFSCMGETPEFIREKVKAFALLPDEKKPKGIVIKNLEALPVDNLVYLEPILNDFNGKKYTYFTALPEFMMGLYNLPPNLHYRLKQIHIKVPSLSERREDIFYLLIHNIMKYSKEFNLNYESIDKSLMDEAREYLWPGNSREMENLIQKVVIENRPPTIKTLKFSKLLEDVKSGEGSALSPLEETERQVILKYLVKNNYNKNRTKNNLQITINTLNAKIIRYGITLPKTIIQTKDRESDSE